MGIKGHLARLTALTLALGAVTAGGLGLAATASADTGPQAPPARGAATGGRPAAAPQPAWVKTDLMTVAARTIGVSEAVLRQEMANGRSLVQVAAAHGIGRGALKTALVDSENADLQTATAGGSVSQAQANQLVSSIPGSIERFLTSARGGGRADNLQPGGNFGANTGGIRRGGAPR